MNKFINNSRLAFIALTAGFIACGNAHAHQLWLEQDGKEATLYFGEYADNLREVSPGLLDRFVNPTVHKISSAGAQQLVATKTPYGFVIAARVGKGETLIARELAYPIRESKDGGKTVRALYVPAARLVVDASAQDQQLTLDLVPTGKTDTNQVELQAFYEGRPLPKAKVTVAAASGWMQELRAGDNGKLMVTMPWAGSYVMEVKQLDAGGERAGEKYDKVNFVTSLSMLQPTGLTALPTPAAAAPGKMN